MRKITLLRKRLFFIYILITLFSANLLAQSWVDDVYVNDDFGTTGGTTSGSWVDGTLTQGYWTGATQSTSNTFSSAINTTNKNVEIKTNVKIGNFVKNIKTFSGTGTPYVSPSGKMTLSFICKIGAAQTYSGAYFYFRDNSNKPIFGMGFARINSGGNKWLAVGPIAYTEWQTGAAANYANITTPALLPTAADAPALYVTAVLDFTKHTYSLTATAGTYTPNTSPEWVAGTNQYVGTSLAFLDNTASNISNIMFEANGLQSSSSTTATNFTFDNFKIVGQKLATTDKVTINYKDQLGNTLKVSRIQNDVEIGTTYTATTSDKATFTDATNYYTYDATSTDNVVVASGGSVIDLHFKIVPITAGTYTWTGITNSLWNNSNENFTTDGTNSIIYQDTNPVAFSASATNKTVTVNDPVNLGTGNVSINAPGYVFNGSSYLNGTGSLLINLTGTDALTLGVTNNLTGVTQVAGGNVTVTKSGVLGSGVNVTGASTLTYGATAVTIPATTFGVSSSIVAGTTASSLISGMSAGNGVKISVSAATNHASNDNTRAFDFAASGTLDSGSELELNGTGTDNRIGMTSASATYLANTKVSLKGAAMLYINNAQSAASIINVGTLAGEAGTKIGWGRSTALDRTITWSVGALNENSEFAGSITNTGGYASGGNSYIGTATNFEKVGTGILTLSGTQTHNGTIDVKAGTLNLTGSLAATVPITVEKGAKLKGTGTILGTLTNHGTLEGSLNFAAITLSDTTSLNVTGFNAGEFDHITATGAIVNGGTLRINIAADPAGEGSIQLFTAGSIDNTAGFTSVKIISPSNPAGVAPKRAPSSTNAGTTYTYDAATGILSYAPKVVTGVDAIHADTQIYPTLSRGNVYVNGENVSSISVVSMNGQIMRQVKSSGNLTTVNMNGLANGSYVLNVKFSDGLSKNQTVLLQK